MSGNTTKRTLQTREPQLYTRPGTSSIAHCRCTAHHLARVLFERWITLTGCFSRKNVEQIVARILPSPCPGLEKLARFQRSHLLDVECCHLRIDALRRYESCVGSEAIVRDSEEVDITRECKTGRSSRGRSGNDFHLVAPCVVAKEGYVSTRSRNCRLYAVRLEPKPELTSPRAFPPSPRGAPCPQMLLVSCRRAP
jgi:hypothetical protein